MLDKGLKNFRKIHLLEKSREELNEKLERGILSMKKQSNLTAIMLVQQLEDEYWPLWKNKDSIHLARDGDCRPLLEETVSRLHTEDIRVDEAYGIIHDKDAIPVWEEAERKTVLTPKTKHIHFLFKFEKGASLQKLAFATGVESQYLEKLKSGRYGYDNCQAYLVHAKDPSKFQYSPENVVTVKGEDYISLYNRKIESWLKGRAKKEAQETNLSIDWLVSEILAGKISKDQILLTDDYYKVYGQHKRKINEALETAGERKSYKAMTSLENGEFKKTIIFVTAASGRGKTAFSKELIYNLQKVAFKFQQNWEACRTASTNPFDEYNGQDILFLDDMRAGSLDVTDWLKLLDPYTISPISARYHNKFGAAKVIIVTSTKAPDDFFRDSTGNINEDLGQFFRRIDCLVTIGKNFSLSNPQKESLLTGRERKCHSPSYSFKQSRQCSKNKASDYLVKLIIRNMQWNKTKKVIDASDQTNINNPISQQK